MSFKNNHKLNLFEVIGFILNHETTVMPLAAIWLSRPLKLSTDGTIKHTVRIQPGDLLFIENGEIKDMIDQPSHAIKECRGKASSDFEITVTDILTGEESIIKL